MLLLRQRQFPCSHNGEAEPFREFLYSLIIRINRVSAVHFRNRHDLPIKGDLGIRPFLIASPAAARCSNIKMESREFNSRLLIEGFYAEKTI